jgi:hypothetical protein
VFQAFQTGDELNNRLLTNGVTGDVTIAAHSLGNMVASQAIQFGGFSPARYYMINAAVPVEAYAPSEVTAAEQQDMVEHDWKSYDIRLYASDWHSRFASSPTDPRNELSWEGRFRDVVPKVYNFFSAGDEVVANAEGVDSAAIGALLLRQGFDFSTAAWKSQELVKGVNWLTSGASLLMDRGQAGWGFNTAWFADRQGLPNLPSFKTRRFPSEASEIDVPTADLQSKPFFKPFRESDLFDPNTSIASTTAAKRTVKHDILARGIPSKSYAMATRRMATLEATSRNFDMQADGRSSNQWPSEGHVGQKAGSWLHSDFKGVALTYVYRMYEAMIQKGALK